MTIPEFLEDKNIVILGYGKQGKATFNYIRKHFKDKKITIADRNTKINKDELDSNVELKLGENYLKDIEKFDLIIKAPGVVLKDVDTSSFENKIITDYELLLKYTPGIKIGITGTKGKSTTSTVLYNALKNQDKDAFLLGNIGKPILDEVDNLTKESYVVVEVSSHTLEFAKTAPQIAILLNIYPEHLDHVNSMEDYVKAKFNIAINQKENEYFIYNAENEFIKNYKYDYKENDIAVYFDSENIENKIKNKVYLKNENIYFNNRKLMYSNIPRKIQGMHTLNNMMFVLMASELLKLDLNKTIEAIQNTEGLEHRMEYVGKYDDIVFYNDAIATIPQATINCIKTLKYVDTLICGGMDRGVDQNELIEFLRTSTVRNIICMPETGYKIYENLKEVKNVYKIDSVEEAVKLAKNITKPNLICLLSPAAASYSHFKNFEEKGKLYKKCVVGNIK
jgi:UDP-N-acetylmuramoylalanine--D-glutamate ligase